MGFRRQKYYENSNITANGNNHIIYLSEDVKDVKVVLIYAKDSEDSKWLLDFHSYSSTIIIGKIFKGYGLKYNEGGLQYEKYSLNENHRKVVGSIVISKDIERILGVLDLDGKVFKQGFPDIEYFFNFISKSKYFRTDKFISSNKEYSNSVLQEFERFLILKGIVNFEKHEIGVELLQRHFPEINFKERIKELDEKAVSLQEKHKKFNGRLVLDSIPEVNKENIGESMRKFKFHFGSKEALDEFLCNQNEEEIIKKFKEVIFA